MRDGWIDIHLEDTKEPFERQAATNGSLAFSSDHRLIGRKRPGWRRQRLDREPEAECAFQRGLPTATAASTLLGLAVADPGPEDFVQDEQDQDDQDRRKAVTTPDRRVVRHACGLEATGDIVLGVVGTPVEQVASRIGLSEKHEKGHRHRETSRESERAVRGSIKITMKS